MNIAEVVQMMSETVLKAAPNHYYKIAWKNFLRYMFGGNTTVTKASACHDSDCACM